MGGQMLDKAVQKAAYNGLPPPADLPEEERAPYLMLCLIYRHFKADELPRETAEVFKTLVCDWEQVPNMEKAALLRYCLANELEQARASEAAGDWDTVWVLMMAYMTLPIARADWEV